MANTYCSVTVHLVFSTKNREPIIAAEIEDRVWAYLGGIAAKNKLRPLCVGGVADHIHMLISLPPTISLGKAVQLIKGRSSKWIHEAFPRHREFAWQRGYGAFSVSASQVSRTINYIKNQPHHHRFKGFQEEYLTFLNKYGVEFDERYLWG
jgi:REP element-mobilizing transposase RayT